MGLTMPLVTDEALTPVVAVALSVSVAADEDTAEDISMETAVTECEAYEARSLSYAVVLARHYYYEVSQTLPLPSSERPRVIKRMLEVKVYAVPLTNLPESIPVVTTVAKLIDASDGCLPYLCPYNPCTDPPLLELRDLLNKGQSRPVFILSLIHI